jgi:hypothetical protein
MMQIEFLPMYATWDDWNGNMIHYFATVPHRFRG